MFHGVGSWRASDMYYFGVKTVKPCGGYYTVYKQKYMALHSKAAISLLPSQQSTYQLYLTSVIAESIDQSWASSQQIV